MTLKKKFEEILYNQSHDDSECLRIRFENIDKVIDSHEKIADDFAIGFAKYVLINNGKYKYIDLEKMLKLFKKEKGL